MRASGTKLATVNIRSDPSGSYLTLSGDPFWSDPGTLWLRYQQPGIYYLPDGEVLDMTRNPPTLANIDLHRHR